MSMGTTMLIKGKLMYNPHLIFFQVCYYNKNGVY